MQKSRNSSVGKQSFFPDEQSSIGVISDGESSILSEEELSPIRKDRKVEYRRSSDQVPTNKERRSNSDSSAKANYEENFPDISESKNAPSEKASSANYLSDKNNNEDMPRPRDDHDNRTRYPLFLIIIPTDLLGRKKSQSLRQKVKAIGNSGVSE